MNKKSFLLLSVILFFVSFLFSCKPRQNLNYFAYNDKDTGLTRYRNYDLPIQVGDQLSIAVSSLNPLTAAPYNPPTGKSLQVDLEGNISYPQLGTIQAAGLTRNQLRDGLATRLRTYLTAPAVTVDFANFKVTVLGEVNRQGSYPVPDGKVNLLEALALAGDLTLYAKRQDVTVIREKNGIRQIGHINLLSNATFSSPFYNLEQNDIVYVEAILEKPTVREQTFTRNFGLVLSIVSLITTLTYIVIAARR